MGRQLCLDCAMGQYCSIHDWEGGLNGRTPSSSSPENRKLEELEDRIKKLEKRKK